MTPSRRSPGSDIKAMMSHRNAIAAAFVAAGIYFGFVVIRDFDSILATQKAFFDLGPNWYVNATTAAILAAPLAYIAVAAIVHQRRKWWLASIPATYGILLTLGLLPIALGLYLLWYYMSNSVETTSEPET